MASPPDSQQWLYRIWALHSGPVFAYAARRVGREHAEDVVADTFMVAWRHREQRPDPDPPWLPGVAPRGSGACPRPAPPPPPRSAGGGGGPAGTCAMRWPMPGSPMRPPRRHEMKKDHRGLEGGNPEPDGGAGWPGYRAGGGARPRH